MENSTPYALITGGTSGIGLELAKLFAENGYHLVLVARDRDVLEATAAELKFYGGEVVTLSKDLFDNEEAFAVYADVKSMGIEIDVLVNDAGQGEFGEFKETDIDRELDIINLNISALVILTKLFVKDMVARNSGKILNLASIASKVPGPWQAVYHGTKAFVLSFSEAIREELRDTDITVTALMPGPTDTDFFAKADMLQSRIVQDKDSLSDPAVVAKDGYEALMRGDDKVISGFKNKVQVGVSNLVPDSTVAHMMYEQQKPADGSET